MKPPAVSVVLLALAGCGVQSSSTLHPELSGPAYSVAGKPTVVFLGDDVTAGWTENNPALVDDNQKWTNAGVDGDTAADALARFQTAVLDVHPDIVHILIGTNDVGENDNWDCFAATDPCTAEHAIQSMVTLAQGAGIAVILGTIPPWGIGTNAEMEDDRLQHYLNIDTLNAWIAQLGQANNIAVIDYHAALDVLGTVETSSVEVYNPTYTDPTDGIIPNAAGYAVMEHLASQAFAKTHAGAPR